MKRFYIFKVPNFLEKSTESRKFSLLGRIRWDDRTEQPLVFKGLGWGSYLDSVCQRLLAAAVTGHLAGGIMNPDDCRGLNDVTDGFGLGRRALWENTSCSDIREGLACDPIEVQKLVQCCLALIETGRCGASQATFGWYAGS